MTDKLGFTQIVFITLNIQLSKSRKTELIYYYKHFAKIVSEYDQKYHNHKPQTTPWHRGKAEFESKVNTENTNKQNNLASERSNYICQHSKICDIFTATIGSLKIKKSKVVSEVHERVVQSGKYNIGGFRITVETMKKWIVSILEKCCMITCIKKCVIFWNLGFQ